MSGMELTLREHKNALIFDSNHELNKEPLRADLLVIRKSSNERIHKTIADIFRTHNIWEYKGFGDELNIDTLSKLIAYTALYKSQGTTVDAIPFSEITASICRYEYPRKLFEDLRRLGVTIDQKHPGIYSVTGLAYFPMQIVILKELEKHEYPELTMLSRGVTMEDFQTFMKQTFPDQGDKNNASALADVVLSGNPELLQKLKEDDEMHKAVEEFLKPTIDERIDKNTLEHLKNIMDRFKVSSQEAMDTLHIPPAEQNKYASRL